MAGSSTALTFLKVLTIISSVILRVSPFPDYYWVFKHKEVGEVALLPVVSLFVNCSAVVMYACVIDDYIPLFATNALGVTTAIGFITIFYLFTTDRSYARKMSALGLLITIIVLVYTLLASTGATHESRHGEGTVLGWITMVTSVVQFGSPLATIMKVIRTRSNASLPLMFCVMNIVNGGLWTAYAVVKWNPFILAPSVVGAAFGVIQVALWVIYRSASPSKYNAKTSNGSTQGDDSVGLEQGGDHCDDAFVTVLTPQPVKPHL